MAGTGGSLRTTSGASLAYCSWGRRRSRSSLRSWFRDRVVQPIVARCHLTEFAGLCITLCGAASPPLRKTHTDGNATGATSFKKPRSDGIPVHGSKVPDAVHRRLETPADRAGQHPAGGIAPVDAPLVASNLTPDNLPPLPPPAPRLCPGAAHSCRAAPMPGGPEEARQGVIMERPG